MNIIMEQKFAGFWLRLAAFFVDSAVLCAGLLLVQTLVSIPAHIGVVGFPMTPIVMGFNLFSVIVVWLYYALFESSKWQATLGKRLLKIKVTGVNGNRISFKRATGRHFSKILSSLICFFGYIMIFFTKKEQALHDMIAETLVVKE